MERFILQQSTHRNDWWVLTDTENLITIRFEKHKFNETQDITILEDSKFQPITAETATIVASILAEMADWMRENHYQIAMPDKDWQRQRIGRRIAEIRTEMGMTQQDLADKTGLIRAHISRIEKGKYSVGFDTLQVIADAFGYDIDFIKREV